MTKATKSLKIAVLDHRAADDAVNFLLVLKDRGHLATQVNRESPTDAFRQLKAIAPDVIHVDLKFEGLDDDHPEVEWWGIKILRLLRSDDAMKKIPVVIESKHLTAAARDVLQHEFGLGQQNIVPHFTKNLGRVAEILEAAKP